MKVTVVIHIFTCNFHHLQVPSFVLTSLPHFALSLLVSINLPQKHKRNRNKQPKKNKIKIKINEQVNSELNKFPGMQCNFYPILSYKN